MSRRFDPGNLLKADAFVAKGEAKKLPSPKNVEAFEEEMLQVRIPIALKNRLKIAAIEQRTNLRAIVLEALHAAGYRE